ncbi:MAG: inositol monophosphatase [Neisseriaceae bacterium]|nr:inositol monophosphatase [Neisseriaceae bacterium]
MSSILNIAIRAARHSAKMMTRAANHLETLTIDQKQANDFVSEIDRESERILSEELLTAYPNHIIRSEEVGYLRAVKDGDEIRIQSIDKPSKTPEYEWIIDPLDGTTNFLHGHAQYAISMALLHKGKIVEGVVFAPERNDLYVASKGSGATLNDKRIRVSKRLNLNEFLIGTGFPVVDQSMIDDYLSILKQVIADTAGARREGSAALDLCSVAAGRFDGFFEYNLKAWDIAAGAFIVKEAGGLVTDFDGENGWLDSGNIVAGNEKALAYLLRTIGKYRTAK